MKKTEKKDYSKKQRVRVLATGDISTTLNVYVHPSEDTKRAAINTALKRVFK